MLGRPNCAVPVLTNSFAGPWLNTSVATVGTMARSSTTVPRCGSSSETQAPHFPWRAKRRPAAGRPAGPGPGGGLEGKRRPLRERKGGLAGGRLGHRPARRALPPRFVVEQLQLPRPPRHEQEDDAFRPGAVVRAARRERVGAALRAGREGALREQ